MLSEWINCKQLPQGPQMHEPQYKTRLGSCDWGAHKNDLNPMKEKFGSFDGALQLQIQWLKCGADSEITREL
jgi:hypothetical protein